MGVFGILQSFALGCGIFAFSSLLFRCFWDVFFVYWNNFADVFGMINRVAA